MASVAADVLQTVGDEYSRKRLNFFKGLTSAELT